MYEVYFDYKDIGDQLLLGIVVKDGADTIIQDKKTVPKDPNLSNYEYSLEAWKWASQAVIDEDLDEVKFMNQNQYIFDWAGKRSYSDIRKPYYEVIIPNLDAMVDVGYQVGFEVIKGTKNLAKKYLNGMSKGVTIAGSFNSLFQQAKIAENPMDKKTAKKARGISAPRGLRSTSDSGMPTKQAVGGNVLSLGSNRRKKA
ncbi:hypothetical protein [Bacillus cereus]|uniref:hypothetical protein n=1 Tax=Bacillus cereus TaxID=1396 RepID=UPI001C8B1CD0|nr:hypothetical protein [Bacillus cereus]MBX9158487.1 hypothetical protein [Bacillus cereus]